MRHLSRQTLVKPELFAVCARKMPTQQLLEWIEWMPEQFDKTLRLARQILFDRIALPFEAPPESLELPDEEKAKKPKHDPATCLMTFCAD